MFLRRKFTLECYRKVHKFLRCMSRGLNIQHIRMLCAFHDEIVALGRFLAHEVADHQFGRECSAGSPIPSRRFSGSSVVSYSVFGFISPRPLNRVISGFTSVEAPQDAVAVRVIQRPMKLFAGMDPIERRQSEVHMAVFDQRGHVSVEEGEQKCRDVVPIASASISRMIRE